MMLHLHKRVRSPHERFLVSLRGLLELSELAVVLVTGKPLLILRALVVLWLLDNTGQLVIGLALLGIRLYLLY